VSIDAEELLEFLRARIARHKVPAQVWIVDELPRVGPGKVNKRHLVERLTANARGR